MRDDRRLTVYFPEQVLSDVTMPPPPPRSSLPVKTSRPSSRNSVTAEKISVSGSRSNRTLPPRPAMAPPSSGRMMASSKPTSGSLLNISSKSSHSKSGGARADQEADIFYSSDSELGHKETQKVKRTNSQLRHKADSKRESKVRNSGAAGEFFEHPDSGWTSRDSSSMDRSSSVSLEEKMDELELSKMRKNPDMMRSEMNLPSQFVGFGLLPDQVYNKAVRKGFEFSLMVVGASGLGKSTMVNSMFLTDIYAEGGKEGGKEAGIGLVTSEPAASEQTLRVETHHR